MSRSVKRCGALLTALVLSLGMLLSGCGRRSAEEETLFDAKLYVEGRLKEAYFGKASDEYLEMVGETAEEAQTIYSNSLYLEAQVFAYLYSIEYPDDFYSELQELYRKIFNHASFEVVAANYEEDGSILVQVDIEPIDIVQRVEAKREEATKELFEKYPADSLNTITTEEYKEYDKEWAELLIQLYTDNLRGIGHLPTESVTVKISKNEEGYYTLPDEEYRKLVERIIDYSAPEQAEPEPSATAGAEGEGDGTAVPPTTAEPIPEASEVPEATETPVESGE